MRIGWQLQPRARGLAAAATKHAAATATKHAATAATATKHAPATTATAAEQATTKHSHYDLQSKKHTRWTNGMFYLSFKVGQKPASLCALVPSACRGGVTRFAAPPAQECCSIAEQPQLAAPTQQTLHLSICPDSRFFQSCTALKLVPKQLLIG